MLEEVLMKAMSTAQTSPEVVGEVGECAATVAVATAL